MKKSGWRLAVAAVLFASWIGYLAYLAATTTQPIVLSRPQFLSTDVFIVGEVSANPTAANQPEDWVTVKKVVWAANADDSKRTKVQVKNLSEVDADHGWHGPEYVLALTRTKEGGDVFVLTPLPRTPGFYGDKGRIYAATPATLRQLEMLKEQYHP